ncbi:hypothetical protein [Candidatus Fokinia crypta]|uniref:Uncharacterized protein n=1 Tax=Candidatus Fokinia crypta TaxID=1920990 RepID=A0ABZ0UPS2_9RICK|nr:hypothetical protein [Candidatus Fokinia cryptica]WPX98123.1 hypothetical protein Fokcrypt_00657 [Candidatus Fokinia cryptica]
MQNSPKTNPQSIEYYHNAIEKCQELRQFYQKQMLDYLQQLKDNIREYEKNIPLYESLKKIQSSLTQNQNDILTYQRGMFNFLWSPHSPNFTIQQNQLHQKWMLVYYEQQELFRIQQEELEDLCHDVKKLQLAQVDQNNEQKEDFQKRIKQLEKLRREESELKDCQRTELSEKQDKESYIEDFMNRRRKEMENHKQQILLHQTQIESALQEFEKNISNQLHDYEYQANFYTLLNELQSSITYHQNGILQNQEMVSQFLNSYRYISIADMERLRQEYASQLQLQNSHEQQQALDARRKDLETELESLQEASMMQAQQIDVAEENEERQYDKAQEQRKSLQQKKEESSNGYITFYRKAIQSFQERIKTYQTKIQEKLDYFEYHFKQLEFCIQNCNAVNIIQSFNNSHNYILRYRNYILQYQSEILQYQSEISHFLTQQQALEQQWRLELQQWQTSCEQQQQALDARKQALDARKKELDIKIAVQLSNADDQLAVQRDDEGEEEQHNNTDTDELLALQIAVQLSDADDQLAVQRDDEGEEEQHNNTDTDELLALQIAVQLSDADDQLAVQRDDEGEEEQHNNTDTDELLALQIAVQLSDADDQLAVQCSFGLDDNNVSQQYNNTHDEF